MDGISPRSYSGLAYRHYAPMYGALSGQGARLNGGRWNPKSSFAVVYTASEPETVDREFERLLERARLPRSALGPRQLATLRMELGNVLDLRDETILRDLGVEPEALLGDDVRLTQQLGEVAHEMGYEAIIAPSATGSGDVIAIFPDNRAANSTLEVVGVRPYPGSAAE